MRNTIMLVIIALLTCCSCHVLKTKKTVGQRRDTIQMKQQWLGDKIILEQRKQDVHQAETGGKNTIEIFTDDVFYWHPDSGIKSRKGEVKVKLMLEQKDYQRSLKFSDTLMAKTNDRMVGEIAYTSESVIGTEEVLDKKRDLNVRWDLLAFGMLLILVLVFVLRILSR